jgi:hypothetical protein
MEDVNNFSSIWNGRIGVAQIAKTNNKMKEAWKR